MPDAASPWEPELSELWGAYEYLRDNDLSEQSNTSRLLHEGEGNYLRARLAGELGELRGVVSGEHRHTGMPDDLVLEGSQVCYWACLLSLRLGIRYITLFDRTISGKTGTRPPAQRDIEQWLLSLAGAVLSADGEEIVQTLREVFAAVYACCLLHGEDVGRLTGYDLSQMKEREYLEPYFSGRYASG